MVFGIWGPWWQVEIISRAVSSITANDLGFQHKQFIQTVVLEVGQNIYLFIALICAGVRGIKNPIWKEIRISLYHV